MGDDYITKKTGIHIGLIPDGNRRWAIEHGLEPWQGHTHGAQKIKDFLQWCLDTKIIPIKEASIFLLSTENLHRPRREVEELWRLYCKEFLKIRSDKTVTENQIKINVLGDENLWHPNFKDAARDAMDATKSYAKHIVNLTVAYGSTTVLKHLVERSTKLKNELERFLVISNPIDFVIRTGGQQRLSNFLLYQCAYAELWFTKALWPSFTKRGFNCALRWYVCQMRKFGK